MNIISRTILSNFCCFRVENVVRIIHHTPIFARLQVPRVLAGRNIVRITRKEVDVQATLSCSGERTDA
jgi:hypothetical protein